MLGPSMRRLSLLLLILVSAALPAAGQALPAPSTPGRTVTDAVYVRPLYGGPYRHCGGECLKSGSLSWFCTERQQCLLNCAVAPPSRKCAGP
ncbi:hypothetical protein [Methylobacterium aerolatum]|uniref:Uncharacterized protein n=1 Tax=Methylobacterium aerolatum TaxID=418708 RepID=A0ABU0I2D3_9HYPH|nr:hypothetical protein [Methylobacterium aerolatum]MDQ0448272.1 hypothetical protein [Methylobacterium aerolatum]